MVNITTSSVDGVRTVAVGGEIDLDTSAELQRALVDACGSGEPEVHVDLSGVAFLDSSGLNALLAGSKEAQQREVRYRVVRPQPQVRKVIDMVGLTELLGVSD